jgi:hypothetical protein
MIAVPFLLHGLESLSFRLRLKFCTRREMLPTRIARFAGSAVRKTKSDGRFNVLLLGAGNINFGVYTQPLS